MLRQMYVIMVKVLVFVGVGGRESRVKSVSHLGMFLRAELFSTQRRIVLKTAVVVHHGEGILMDFQMGSAVGNLMGDVIEEQSACY